jgi:hypothetical protein
MKTRLYVLALALSLRPASGQKLPVRLDCAHSSLTVYDPVGENFCAALKSRITFNASYREATPQDETFWTLRVRTLNPMDHSTVASLTITRGTRQAEVFVYSDMDIIQEFKIWRTVEDWALVDLDTASRKEN